jgi:hypothetical protein
MQKARSEPNKSNTGPMSLHEADNKNQLKATAVLKKQS